MSIAKYLSLAAAITLLASPSFAQTRLDKDNARLDNQDKRIEQGVGSGELTNKEATHLEKRETKLGGDIAKADADGKITAKEQHHLNREEKRDSRAIHRQKHDAQTAK